ncbi:MAG: hypothetical protein U1E17_07895 [Geminicoccaceae bacterium]
MEASEAELRAFCEGRIAHYKVPRYIRFVDSFPDHGHGQGAEIPAARRDRGRASG